MKPSGTEPTVQTPSLLDALPAPAGDGRRMEICVLEVLAGNPLHQVAKRNRLRSGELAEALECYQAAGRAALRCASGDRWIQINIRFADWSAAEQLAATLLASRLMEAQSTGAICDWWFLRKHPCWRLRYRPGPRATTSTAKAAMGTILERLSHGDGIAAWQETIYEPEAFAFGGAHGIDIAHRLFHADSRGVLHFLHCKGDRHRVGSPVGRREISVLLYSALMRAAGLEWHERADVWDRVTLLRPLSPDTARIAGHLRPGPSRALLRLLTVDTSAAGPMVNRSGPLEFAAPWLLAHETAGHDLRKATDDGTLQRGLRDLIAHLVIFHWNRLGITDPTQGVLAKSARDTIVNPARPSDDAGSTGGR